MSAVPNVETILLKLNEAFGSNELQTLQKKRFVRQEKSLMDHIALGGEVIENLRITLNIPKSSKLFGEFLQAIDEFINWYAAVEANTRNYDADLRQIVWGLCIYQIVPGQARKYGFWSSAEPVAFGMPYGDLWFLPRLINEGSDRLQLPVQSVVDWWLDLLDQKYEDIWSDERADRRIRSLQNWRQGKTPDPDTMAEYFLSEHSFKYNGVFVPSKNDGLEKTFERAVKFVSEVKGLSHNQLAAQIPRASLSFLNSVFYGQVDQVQKKEFIKIVSDRWSKPLNEMVSRRFLIARALQYGYKQLVDLICPGVPYDCADPLKNKTMQLVELFKYVYEKTIEADEGCNSVWESDNKFHKLVSNDFVKGPLVSVMPLDKINELEFGAFLSTYFRALKTGKPLQDLFKNGYLSSGLNNLPHKVLEHFKGGIEDLLKQLHQLFMSEQPDRQREIEKILRDLEGHPDKDGFEADILYMQARHLLAQNDIEGTQQKLEEAFNVCKIRSFGSMRRRIAWACLGLQSAFSKFDKRSEKYIRVLLASVKQNEMEYYHSYDDFVANFHRDKTREAHSWFWEYFYKTYPNVERMRPVYVQPFEELIKDLFKIHTEDELSNWLSKNKNLLEKQLQDVDGNTFFTVLQKMINSFDQMLTIPGIPRPQKNETVQLIASLRNITHFLARRLSKRVLNCTDLKGQTALGLAVSHKDLELVKILIERKVDLNKQTYQGKTALHEAAAIRSSECFMLLVDSGADPTLRTIDELTPIHTAVRFGLVDVVRHFLINRRHLLSANDIEDMLGITSSYYDNYKKLRPIFAQDNRVLPPKIAYKKIESLLADHN
ncbi:ankyrin repeat domain-containing protein [Terasakiella pusilla]|uniref:ankyrin repeat domain-containing protein n=1 Tax=Terasakiella pusilla TaxID=64973 RepID=UPI003AA975FC